MAHLDTAQLRRTLERVGARWDAREPRREYRLGFTPGPEDPSLAQREFAATVGYRQFAASLAAAAYPPATDWRNFGAQPPLPAGNYVTPVRDQQDCGSCVAFGTLAAMESAVAIAARQSEHGIDLSEADLFYCHAEAEQGRRCDGPEGGWWPDAALDVCRDAGVVDEACFPYVPGDQPCRRCADAPTRLTRISAWRSLTSTADMKQWLATRGPLVTAFSVYEDFFAYQNGVYHHVSGALAGGHCVCCVGYDDDRRFWICKNSWGDDWGQRGFFNIAYGQVGIDATMWAVEL